MAAHVGCSGDGFDRGLLLGLLVSNGGQELADGRAGLARMFRADDRTRRLVLAAWPAKALPLHRGRWRHAHSLGLRGRAAARVAPSSPARDLPMVPPPLRIAISRKTFSPPIPSGWAPQADAMALGSMLIGMAAALALASTGPDSRSSLFFP